MLEIITAKSTCFSPASAYCLAASIFPPINKSSDIKQRSTIGLGLGLGGGGLHFSLTDVQIGFLLLKVLNYIYSVHKYIHTVGANVQVNTKI